MARVDATDTLDPRDRILEAAKELVFARDVEAIADVVRRAARELTGADGVTFVLRDGAHCYYADEDAIAPLWKGRRFPMETCISGWVMQRGEPVAIPDVYRDPRIPHDVYRKTFVQSLVMVPVRTPDPVAAIGAYWATAHAATREQLHTLQRLADTAALALANVRLYQELHVALERERHAREDAEAAAQAKDDVVAILAHEMRQPLAACAAAVALLRARPDWEANARARGVVDRQLTRMTRLVEDLLDASKVIRGQAGLAMTAVDVCDVVQQALETASPLVLERGHTVSFETPATPCFVEGDPRRLEQVFANLITNAAKYTPRGGAIRVAIREARGHVAVAVRDTGIGIEPDNLSRIFNLFTRGAHRDEPGLGVGLAVARRLVEQHRGTLRVRSEGAGTGSEFIVQLPVGGERDERKFA